MKQALIYSLKVWLSTALLSPIIYLFPFEAQHGNQHESGLIFLLIPVSMIVGCVCILPYWLLLAVVIFRFNKVSTSLNDLKTISSAMVALLSAVTIAAWHIWSGIDLDLVGIVIVYIVVSVGSVWFYKLKPVKQSEIQKYD